MPARAIVPVEAFPCINPAVTPSPREAGRGLG
jgi:hypothetical protein